MKYKIYIFILLSIIVICGILTSYENFGRAVGKTVVDKDKKFIYKTFKKEGTYKKIKDYYKNILVNWDFCPRMEFDDKKLTIKEEYFDTILTKLNKPKDYIKQLVKIDKTIKKVGLFHNDYRTKGPGHFFIKDGKIYLIDYDGLSTKQHLPRNDIQKIIDALE